MTKDIPYFYFRHRAEGHWSEDNRGKRILFRGQEVGYIVPSSKGFVIRYKADADSKDSATNPNCEWAWHYIKSYFDNVELAMDFIKDDPNDFYDMLYSGVKE